MGHIGDIFILIFIHEGSENIFGHQTRPSHLCRSVVARTAFLRSSFLGEPRIKQEETCLHFRLFFNYYIGMVLIGWIGWIGWIREYMLVYVSILIWFIMLVWSCFHSFPNTNCQSRPGPWTAHVGGCNPTCTSSSHETCKPWLFHLWNITILNM